MIRSAASWPASDRVRLRQVRAEEHAGTFEGPYVASGVVVGGCYPYIEGSAWTAV